MRRLRSHYLGPLSILSLALAGPYLLGACSGKNLESGPGQSSDDPPSLEKEEAGENQENQVEEQVGWTEKQGESFYFEAGSGPVKGWKNIDDKRYYFSEDGSMVKGWLTLGGKSYILDNTGALCLGKSIYGSDLYFSDENGVVQTGWQQVGEELLYFDKEGRWQSEIGGIVDYKKNLSEVLNIERQVYDELYLYENLANVGEELRLSDIKSYIEIPVITGAGDKVDRLREILDEDFFELKMSNWEITSRVHNNASTISYFSSTSVSKTSVRLFDSGDVTALMVRSDYEGSFEGPNYYYKLYLIDNHTGQLVNSRKQVESMGIDPLIVLRKLEAFIKDNSQIYVEDFSYEEIEGLFNFDLDAWYKVKNNYKAGDTFFVNKLSIDEDEFFVVVEDETPYIMAMLYYYVNSGPSGSLTDDLQYKLVRIPFNYEGGKLKEYVNDGYFWKDQTSSSADEEAYPFTGIFDMALLIYE